MGELWVKAKKSDFILEHIHTCDISPGDVVLGAITITQNKASWLETPKY